MDQEEGAPTYAVVCGVSRWPLTLSAPHLNDARGAQHTVLIGGVGVQVVDCLVQLVGPAEVGGQYGVGDGLQRAGLGREIPDLRGCTSGFSPFRKF